MFQRFERQKVIADRADAGPNVWLFEQLKKIRFGLLKDLNCSVSKRLCGSVGSQPVTLPLWDCVDCFSKSGVDHFRDGACQANLDFGHQILPLRLPRPAGDGVAVAIGSVVIGWFDRDAFDGAASNDCHRRVAGFVPSGDFDRVFSRVVDNGGSSRFSLVSMGVSSTPSVESSSKDRKGGSRFCSIAS